MPPNKPVITDRFGKKMTSSLGPFKLGDTVRATCTTTGGDPPPRLTWYREHVLIDDTFESKAMPSSSATGGGTTVTTTINELDYAATPVSEEDLNAVFTCQVIETIATHD